MRLFTGSARAYCGTIRIFSSNQRGLKVGSEGITGWVAKTGEAALVPDVTQDAHYVWMQGSLTRSELTVPISVKGQTIGVLDVQSELLDDFDQTDAELLQAIASQTGIAIENARLFAETQRHLKETERRANKLTIINSLQHGLASKLDVQSIYELVGEKFRDIFGAQVVMISTYDPKLDTVEHRYSIERGRACVLDRRASAGRVPRRRSSARASPCWSIPTWRRRRRGLASQPCPAQITPKSWLGVPMLVGDQVTGILSVQNLDKENAFDESGCPLLADVRGVHQHRT